MAMTTTRPQNGDPAVFNEPNPIERAVSSVKYVPQLTIGSRNPRFTFDSVVNE
uniref:Unannotated protein n=1 Tax=freshwater metagenome TaxID=449393 RepID=A0A6J7Q625_9ZZZZ